MNKKHLIIVIAAVLCCCHFADGKTKKVRTDSTRTDTVAVSKSSAKGIKINKNVGNWETYNPERGFFQKAYTDKSDPRFMISDETDKFSFGIGGEIRLCTFCDFCGAVNDKKFSTVDIVVPTSKSTQFGLSVGGSKLYFKTRAKLGRHTLIGYGELNTLFGNNNIELGKLYISYAGFTLGQTYSFFMDLEAGPMTVDDKGPNAKIDKTHPLIGYSIPVKGWTFGLSLELPKLELGNFSNFGVDAEFQTTPDVCAFIKYKTDIFHIQAAGVFRHLKYKSVESLTNTNLISRSAFGWGAALSAKINITKSLSLSCQGVYGRGISSYINGLGGARLDIMPGVTKALDYIIEPIYCGGAYASLQYDWSKKFLSALVYGFIKVQGENKYELFNDFDHSHYVAANFFWKVTDYLIIGGEYLFGYKKTIDLYSPDNGKLVSPANHGIANRFGIMARYSF